MVQKTVISPVRFFSRWKNDNRSALLGEKASANGCGLLSFFEDQESLRWRYLEGQYERLDWGGKAGEYLIVKRGSSKGYLRLCQWRVDSANVSFSLMSRLVQMAEGDGALGVRWAVYGSDRAAAVIVRRLRNFGFLCAPRVRTLLLRADDKEFLAAEKWNLNDSIFSFHH